MFRAIELVGYGFLVAFAIIVFLGFVALGSISPWFLLVPGMSAVLGAYHMWHRMRIERSQVKRPTKSLEERAPLILLSARFRRCDWSGLGST